MKTMLRRRTQILLWALPLAALTALSAVLRASGWQRAALLAAALLGGAGVGRLWRRRPAESGEARFRDILQSLPVGIALIDPHSLRITDINDRAAELIGAGRDAVIGTSADSVFAPLVTAPAPDGGPAGHDSAAYRIQTGSGRPNLVVKSEGRISLDGRPRIVFSFLDISERARSEAQLARLTGKLRTVSEITKRISALMDPEQLFRQVIELIQEATGCYSANLFLREGDVLKLVWAGGGYVGQPPPIGYPLPVGRGIIGCAAREGRPLLVADVHLDPRYVFYDGLPLTRSELSIPLRYREQLLGVLDIQSVNPQDYDSGDMEAILVYADQVAVAIENARLFDEARQRTRELETLAGVSAELGKATSRASMLPVILSQIRSVLQAHGAAIVVRAPDGAGFVIESGEGVWAEGQGRAVPGEGFLGDVWRDGDVRRRACGQDAPDCPLGGSLPALAAAAMTGRHEPFGLLLAGRDREFNDSELRIFAAVAYVAANALRRITLSEQIEQRLRQMEALRTIDISISASLDLRVTLNILLDQVRDQLGVDAATVLLYRAPTQTLEYGASRGFLSAALRHTRLRLGEGFAGRAAQERQMVQALDLQRQANGLRRSPQLAGEGFASYIGVPLLAKNQVKGVLEIFHRTPLRPEADWYEFLEALSGQAAIAVDNASLFEELQRANIGLVTAYDATIEGWARTLEYRDQETEGHSRRVTDMTLNLATALDLPMDELVHVRRGALLHDIGKMGIPDEILLKPGKLSDEEWRVMSRHPDIAVELLAPISFLGPALVIPHCHHEKWDGTGYPRQLKGEQIPLAARIFAVVDVWDALCSDRPYRKAWPPEKVTAHIAALSGSHFDPRVVAAFLKLVAQESAGA